jgi:hypothetical protein
MKFVGLMAGPERSIMGRWGLGLSRRRLQTADVRLGMCPVPLLPGVYVAASC